MSLQWFSENSYFSLNQHIKEHFCDWCDIDYTFYYLSN